MKKGTSLVLFIFMYYSILAQQIERRDMMWQFSGWNNWPELGGNNQTLVNLNSGDPVFTIDSFPVEFHVTYSSICDTTGNLLLYTNGVSILNSLHEFIEGGDTITLHNDQLEGFSSLDKQIPQGALFLPSPANNGIYYLFHEEFQRKIDWTTGMLRFRIPQIYLTTIDMNANGGKGKVLEKNVVIAERDSLFDKGRILAVRHANGRDWWVVITQYRSAHLTKFLVTPNGVLPQPDIVIEEVMFPAGDPEQAAFSPDGTKYAITGGDPAPQKRYFYLFDFDRCTGTVYNQQIKEPENPWLWGVFFSPDSRYLYWIHNNNSDVTQYDLQEDDWYSSGIQVYEWEGNMFPFPTVPTYGYTAADGRLYLSPGNEVKVMHIINQPNKRSDLCDFQKNIETPTMNYATFPNFPNFRLGPIDGSSCDTLGINNDPVSWWRWQQDTASIPRVGFTDLSYHEPASWTWDFGDGSAVSQDTSPVHLFPMAGTYTVCLTVDNVNGSSTYCKEVVVTGVSGVQDAEGMGSGWVSIQPNPASEFISLSLNLPEGFSGKIEAYDMIGRKIAHQNITNTKEHSLNCSSWNNGMVILLLMDDYGKIYDSVKVNIQH